MGCRQWSRMVDLVERRPSFTMVCWPLAIPTATLAARRRGAVWLLELAENSGVLYAHAMIGEAELGLSLANYAWFGMSLAKVPDLDGDGLPELAVGSWEESGGPHRRRVRLRLSAEREPYWCVALAAGAHHKQRQRLSRPVSANK